MGLQLSQIPPPPLPCPEPPHGIVFKFHIHRHNFVKKLICIQNFWTLDYIVIAQSREVYSLKNPFEPP